MRNLLQVIQWILGVYQQGLINVYQAVVKEAPGFGLQTLRVWASIAVVVVPLEMVRWLSCAIAGYRERQKRREYAQMSKGIRNAYLRRYGECPAGYDFLQKSLLEKNDTKALMALGQFGSAMRNLKDPKDLTGFGSEYSKNFLQSRGLENDQQ